MLMFGFRAVPHCTIRCQAPLYRHGNKSDNHHLKKDTVNVANIKSQIKRIITNAKANERNKAVKSEVKTAVRATRTAIAAGDKVAAEAALKNATKKLDKAVSKGVLHKNNAANRKSAIAKSVASL
jgi:small subunit ribosomal protein S20